MSLRWIPQVLVGLLPVLVFLAALLYLDSYKLVKLRTVVATMLAGALMAGASYYLNGMLLSRTGQEMETYSRYVAPFSEELLKAIVVVMMLRLGRIGFLVDAAIFGFAVGAGFSILENVYYLVYVVGPEVGIGTWIIRGFGTAIMHGGATAVFAVVSLNLIERQTNHELVALVPGFLMAYAVHSAYNHVLLPPIYQTFVVIVTLPLLLTFVFRRSEKSLGAWLGSGFDADAQLMELLNSGKLADSPLGKYLFTLRSKFQGPIVADILCYVRLYTELALRAKGILIMREAGFDTEPDQELRDKFTEMRFLERSIGRTGQMAIRPMLHVSLKDLRQLYLLEEA